MVFAMLLENPTARMTFRRGIEIIHNGELIST